MSYLVLVQDELISDFDVCSGNQDYFLLPESNVHEIISSYYPMCISTVMGEVIGPGVHNNTHAMYQIQTIDLSYLKLY